MVSVIEIVITVFNFSFPDDFTSHDNKQRPRHLASLATSVNKTRMLAINVSIPYLTQANFTKRNWYQKEVDEEMKRVGSRDNVKHNERNDQLLLLLFSFFSTIRAGHRCRASC